MKDLIERQAAIAHLKKRLIETAINNIGVITRCDSIFEDTADNRIGPWLNELPSEQPEIIRCRECKWHRFDKDNIPYCYNIDYGYGWKDDEFCSRAERREVSE